MSRSETAMLWQERLRRFDRSQMTVAQFCLSEGISQPSYYKWRKKLLELPSVVKPKPSATEVQFMPLHLATESANQDTLISNRPTTAPFACTTIELPGGVRIKVEVPTKVQSEDCS